MQIIKLDQFLRHIQEIREWRVNPSLGLVIFKGDIAYIHAQILYVLRVLEEVIMAHNSSVVASDSKFVQSPLNYFLDVKLLFEHRDWHLEMIVSFKQTFPFG
jgi:peptide subunit release factor 1 (eRF1)